MKKEKIGFGVSLGLTILFFCTFGVFGVLTCKSCMAMAYYNFDMDYMTKSDLEERFGLC